MANAGQQVPGRRWMIGCLLGVGILINYIDRVGLSAATPELTRELGLTATDIGLLGSAFFWTYSLLQVPGGMVLDRFGVTMVGRASSFLWAVAATITALASGLWGIAGARLLLGVAEAPAFPASQKATGHWFPLDERARSASGNQCPVAFWLAGNAGASATPSSRRAAAIP